MSIIKTLNKLLFGTTLPQEYVCVGFESFQSPLDIILAENNGVEEKIENNNFILLGYLPLLVGINTPNTSKLFSILNDSDYQKIFFKYTSNKTLSWLKVKKIQTINYENNSFFIFRGFTGSHKFSSLFHKFLKEFKYRITGKTHENIYLYGNLYDQVKIAYSIPCAIRLVCVAENDNINIFPSDLNGNIDDEYYVISLRVNGKANQQVEKLKKVLITGMPADTCKQVYALGKNHMQDLKTKNDFDIESFTSQKYGLPVPKNALFYYELELQQSISEGVHNLLFFRVQNFVKLNDNKDSLAHIHRDYAEWMIKNYFPVKFILR